MNPRRRPPALLFLAALVATLALCTAPAAAHGAEGEVTVTKLEQTGPTTVEVEVGIVYAGDGHLAEEAVVTATLSGPAGATIGPVELTRTGETTSLYAARVEVPSSGDWSVAVTSAEPTGAASGSVTLVEGFAATTTTQAPDGATASSATVEAPEPITATDDPDATESAAAADDAGDIEFLSGPVVAASLALFALVIGGGVLVARRRERADSAGDAVDS